MAEVIALTDTDGALSASRHGQAGPEYGATLRQSYGVLANHDTGLAIGRGIVEPGETMPLHAAENSYALLVLSGSGHLMLFDPDGRESGRHPFQQGDLVLLPPQARHDWVADEVERFERIGVDMPWRF